ncbi:uncharacterized protein VTP21DRAFT_9831 [Calcarisporiella thermophila]|uniref:uncharacterized protein n=1 Tax=Calcarisporiella thermophila TaxID=911321 RepID=UPI0037429C4C
MSKRYLPDWYLLSSLVRFRPGTRAISLTPALSFSQRRSKSEQELYLKLTQTFRQKLLEKTSQPATLYNDAIINALSPLKKAKPGKPQLLHDQISQACARGDVADLRMLAKRAIETGEGAVAYQRLMLGFIKAGEPEDAIQLYNDLLSEGHLPTRPMLTLLISATLRKQRERCEEYVRVYHALGFRPGNKTEHVVLLRYHIWAQEIEHARKVWYSMRSKHFLDGNVGVDYMGFLVKSGLVGEAAAVAKEVGGDGIVLREGQPKRRALELVKTFARNGYAIEAESLLLGVVAARDDAATEGVVEAYLAQNLPARALRFTRDARELGIVGQDEAKRLTEMALAAINERKLWGEKELDIEYSAVLEGGKL